MKYEYKFNKEEVFYCRSFDTVFVDHLKMLKKDFIIFFIKEEKDLEKIKQSVFFKKVLNFENKYYVINDRIKKSYYLRHSFIKNRDKTNFLNI